MEVKLRTLMHHVYNMKFFLILDFHMPFLYVDDLTISFSLLGACIFFLFGSLSLGTLCMLKQVNRIKLSYSSEWTIAGDMDTWRQVVPGRNQVPCKPGVHRRLAEAEEEAVADRIDPRLASMCYTGFHRGVELVEERNAWEHRLVPLHQVSWH